MTDSEQKKAIINQVVKAYTHAEAAAHGRPFVVTVYTDAEGNVGVWTGQPAGLIPGKIDSCRTPVLN